MPCHPDRVRRNYQDDAPPRLSSGEPAKVSADILFHRFDSTMKADGDAHVASSRSSQMDFHAGEQ